MIRIGVIGYGSIGKPVAEALRRGEVDGAQLVGVHTRRRASDEHADWVAFDELVDRSDVIVEAAGQAALAEYGPRVIDAGRQLLAVSVGALTDHDLEQRLQSGAGLFNIVTGAIGGVDLLRAACLAGPVTRIAITSRKQPQALFQPWMSNSEVRRIRDSDTEVVVGDGPAREIVQLFPRSTNVAATLAIAAGNWDIVSVRVIADPLVDRTEHEIEVSSEATSFRIVIRNRPDANNPSTSGIVPYAALRGLRDIVGRAPCRFV